MDDKDIVIGILIQQRNNLMNQLTDLQFQLWKATQPKDPQNDNVGNQ